MNKEQILDNLKQIQVAAYDIYEDPKLHGGECSNDPLADPVRFEIGCIAQQLNELFPHLVHSPSNEKEDLYQVDYTMLTPILLLGLKEALHKIELLEGRIKKLESE